MTNPDEQWGETMDPSTDAETSPPDGASTTADPSEPAFDRSIPRKLVHKAGPEAVWLTEIAQVGEHHYRCAGHVPRTHTLVNDAAEPAHTYYDLAFLTELGRQAGIATMHEYEGAPVDWATVFLKFDLELVDPVPNARSPGPVPVIVDVRYRNRETEEGGLTVLAELTFEIDGVVRARATSMASAYEKGPYKAWRRDMRDDKPLTDHEPRVVEPIAPERVGRRDPDNVMIGELRNGAAPGAYRCAAHVDTLHPHFFEHPMDHIPGVVHLEVMRQAALVAAHDHHGVSPAGATIASARTKFLGFAELELPLDCDVAVGRATPEQDGVLAVPVSLTLSQPGNPKVTTARMVVRGFSG
ncbi:MAG: AfsA-related hotdog domain-containing protein [Egibacteraceae bacterium]